MKTYASASEFNGERETVVTIGTFDGVHLGHKSILRRLIQTAKEDGLESVVLTFFPHPRLVLQQNSDLKLINTIEERAALLEKSGIHSLIIHPFTQDFSRLTAEEYVHDILVRDLNVKKLIIGYDHRFGRNRNADISDLRKYGKELGFEIEEISAKEIDDVAISSTKIRKALDRGDVETANECLGYRFMITGEIVPGKALGRTIGYPTANLHLKETYKMAPLNGVYVVRSVINEKEVFGITSIGTNPTVGGKKKTIETHFLDFDEDLYGEKITLEFLKFIRPEATFNSLEELRNEIAKDENFAKKYLETLDLTSE
ncbi:MAG TPA: bifunctional riboflavin kinase/FAD synthetase [Flavobacteriaceae bacterium]|nr:bifunctional riboflavin kinase/FAD synthetase [Flavobacteriaceae bacterium]